jgi:hypothetical protein
LFFLSLAFLAPKDLKKYLALQYFDFSIPDKFYSKKKRVVRAKSDI